MAGWSVREDASWIDGAQGAHEVKPFVQINIGYIDEGVDALAVRNRDLLPPGEPCPDFMRDYITEMFGSNPEIVEQFFEWIENPHADHFLNFLENELHPFVKDHYNVGDDEAGVFGFSYGGLFSIYALTAGSSMLFHQLWGGKSGHPCSQQHGVRSLPAVRRESGE